MSDAEPTAPSEASAAPPLDVGELQAPVRFDLGVCLTSLRTLEALQPGYVFELTGRVADGVSICVNNATIGRGELVRVGDRLGVRVVEVNARASDDA